MQKPADSPIRLAKENCVIRLTRINHVPLVVNSDLIEHLEVTPDTVISLTTGQKFVVLETPAEVIERVVAFRRAIHDPAVRLMERRPDAEMPRRDDEEPSR